MSSKGRILVVDDDRLVLATLCHGLAQAGYQVIDADNGSDAILLADERRPELALLDIRMEGLSGFDVAAYLRDVCRIPFVFLSAFSDDETAARVRDLGAAAYLIKPLDVGQIVPTVDTVFARLRQGGPSTAAATPAAVQVPLAAPGATPVTAAAAASEADAEAAAGLAAVAAVGEPLDPLSLAVGILMHRYSLSRPAAVARLLRGAAEQGLSAGEQAGRLVRAVEELSR